MICKQINLILYSTHTLSSHIFIKTGTYALSLPCYHKNEFLSESKVLYQQLFVPLVTKLKVISNLCGWDKY